MKKCIALIMLFLSVNTIVGVSSVFSQNETDEEKIRIAVVDFIKARADGNFDSVVSHLSKNYNSESICFDVPINYEKALKMIKSHGNEIIDIDIEDIEINDLVVDGDSASLNLQFRAKGFTLTDADSHETIQKRIVRLVRENNNWMIIVYSKLK